MPEKPRYPTPLYAYNTITRIHLTYTRIRPVYVPAVYQPVTTLHYEEELTIERDTETMTHRMSMKGAYDISHSYHVAGGISHLLDSLDYDLLREELAEWVDIGEEPPQGAETKTYILDVSFAQGQVFKVHGYFDAVGLPPAYGQVASALRQFITQYSVGDICSEALYLKGRRRKGDLIFCGISFHRDSSIYTYLTQDDTLEVGDYVIVPVGAENREMTGRIEEIQYLPPREAPYPLDKIKYILRKK